MKSSEKGFTLLELIVGVGIMALVAVAASAAIFQVLRSNDRNNDYLTAVRQVENAGFWISRDAEMAQIVYTDNQPPDFLVLKWAEWVPPTDQKETAEGTYYSVTYSFTRLTNGIGSLMRSHISSASAGVSDNIVVASYIYYDLGDADNTSKASYESPVLTVQLTALVGQTRETREYRIKRRTNY